jgi:hypothetical protein
MVKYRCFRCNYTANHKTSMYNHYARSVKCSKNIDSLKFDENQIVKYSFTEIDDHKRLDNINYNNYCVEKNSEEFINEIKNVYKEKQRSCSYCNKIFAKYKDLEYHLFECIYITNKIKNEKENSLSIDNSVNAPSNIYTECNVNNINNNINNVNNINNTININIELPEKSLISFNDNWNIEHLDINTKTLLFMSTVKYTKTLEYILANDANKNVLLNKDTNTGIIYKGAEFEEMKIEDIIDKSVLKIYNNLKEMYNEIQENNDVNFILDPNVINQNLKITENKFNEYNSNEKTKEVVSQIISSIYSQHKDTTEQKYKVISSRIDDKIKF